MRRELTIHTLSSTNIKALTRSTPYSELLRHSDDAFDLDFRAGRHQRRHGDSRAGRRLLRKELPIRRVHSREIFHVGEKYRALRRVAHIRASGLGDLLKILERSLCLSGDRRIRIVTCHAELTGKIDDVAVADRRREKRRRILSRRHDHLPLRGGDWCDNGKSKRGKGGGTHGILVGKGHGFLGGRFVAENLNPPSVQRKPWRRSLYCGRMVTL